MNTESTPGNVPLNDGLGAGAEAGHTMIADDDVERDEASTPTRIGLSEGLGPTVPKRKGLGDLIDELVDASVSLEMAQRPQSIQLCSLRVERLEEEVRARLDERGFTVSQLAEACISAEIPDSTFESLLLALRA